MANFGHFSSIPPKNVLSSLTTYPHYAIVWVQSSSFGQLK